MAVAHDVDLATLRSRLEDKIAMTPTPGVGRKEVEDKRHILALDLSMREIAIDKGLIDIREISSQFSQQWREYKRLKDEFDVEWDKLQQGATDRFSRFFRRCRRRIRLADVGCL